MRIVSVSKDLKGQKLGKTIYDENGRPLIIEGTSLRPGLLEGLLNHNITNIYIKDSRTDDIVIEECIPIEMRVRATKQIKEVFDSVREANSGFDTIISNNLDSFKSIVRGITSELQKNVKALSILSTVKAYEDSIFSHSLNVMIYSVQIGIHKGYGEKDLENLGLGALLHDVGKLLVPLEVLNKETKLSDEEFSMIKEHAELGFGMLRKNYEIPLIVSHCAYQHHEHIDGRGYPRGLVGDKIHEYARIMAIADVFDAVTSDRKYRKAMLPHEGMELIYSGAGSQFDIDLVDIFKRCTIIYPLGMGVVLSNGYRGVVVRNDPRYTGRPVVRLLKDKDGKDIGENYEIDMTKDLNIVIVDSDLIFK